MGGLVEVAANSYGATAPPERRLDHVGDVGLPSPRLATDKHHDIYARISDEPAQDGTSVLLLVVQGTSSKRSGAC
ncbi:hypothetical protein [Streptomyces sp. AM6-12]|uniref:hypothetical protein n=1 Tax=Streptomyces sp. AM6-12 TaxID=3345149 RepID=UPI00378FE82C